MSHNSASHPSHGKKYAPIYHVPNERVVTVEHPCIVRDIVGGLKSLGGEPQLKHILEHKVGDSKHDGGLPEPIIGASLRPYDPFARKLPSAGIEARNVLLKITVPKRTGRKRKRGTDEAFESSPEPGSVERGIAAEQLQRRLQDTAGFYQVEAISMLREIHRFRTLPDFQLRSSDLPIMQKLRDNVMRPDYAHLKEFTIDLSPGFQNDQAFPGPPNFAHVDLPHRYEYQQAPGVVVIPDADGNLVAKNVHGPARKITWALPPDIEEVPQEPPNNIPKTSPHGVLLPRAIRDLEKLLDERPLVTKRVALNAIPACSDTIFKEATQFVGYSFGAGPWRDTLIKYGVDPRKDPKYRIYQTLMFQMDKKEFKAPTGSTTQWSRSIRFKKDSSTSHVFDGTSITPNGKTWQICDLTDPVLAQIAATEDLPSECDVQRCGWYHNGTLAKIRAVMKDKFRLLFAGETPVNGDYDAILTLPDEIHQGNIEETILTEKRYGKRVSRIALDIRNVSKARKLVKDGYIPTSVPSAEMAESVAHILAEDVAQDASDGDEEETAGGDFDDPASLDTTSQVG